MWYDDVNTIWVAVTDSRLRFWVKVVDVSPSGHWVGGGAVGWVRKFERVVGVDVAVGVGAEVVEDMSLERVGRFHYESVKIKPPEPVSLTIVSTLTP